jgi:integrase
VSLYRIGRIWHIDIQHDGRRTRRTTGTADRKAAQEFHDKIAAQLWRQARLGEPPARTFYNAIAEWLKEAPRDQSDRYRLKALLRRTSDLSLSGLTVSFLDDAIGPQTGAAYNRTANLIEAVLHLAQAKGWIHAVPKIPRKPVQSARTRWLTAEEWQRLRKHLPAYMERMARFALATGLRENNVLTLRWDQIDMRRKVAWIHPDQAKAGKAVGVPLNADAMAVLEERRAAQRDEELGREWVFPNPDGEPYYKASNRAWREARIKAGLPDVRWHDLRHTWASWAMMNGVRLEELQRLGGWKTPAMVMRYAHLAPEHLARAAESVKPVSLKPGRAKRMPK